MANRNYYPNLPGVRAVYNDGQLSQTTDNAQGRALFIGTAKQGPSFRKISVDNVDNAAAAYQESELMDQVLGSIRAGNDSIRVERIGGRQTHHLIKSAIPNSKEKSTLLKVSLVERLAADSEELKKYRLAFLPYKDGNIYRQRILGLYYDTGAARAAIVYDSEMILAQDAGLFEIEILIPNGAGNILHTPGIFGVADAAGVAGYANISQPNLARIKQADAVPLGDTFDSFGAGVLHKLDGAAVGTDQPTYTYEVIDGRAGEDLSHCERYANLEISYEDLEYTDAEFLVPEKCYADILPLDLGSVSKETAQEYANHSLGYLWKYVYRGRPYMFMFGRPSPFTDTDVDQGGFAQTVSGAAITFTVSAAQAKLGDLLNLVEYHFHFDNLDEAGYSVEVFPNEKGLIEVHVSYDTEGAGDLSVDTPFATLLIPNNTNIDNKSVRLRASKSLCDAAVAGTPDRVLSTELLAGDYNSDPFVMTHYDLTGELIPEEVLDRLLSYDDTNPGTDASLVASNVEVREINLAHQAAQAAYKASTSYSQTIAFAQLTRPVYGRDGISVWAGEAPTYEANTAGEIVVATDGTGVMSNKFLFGSTSYRSGSAYGGFICTVGNSLPNELPYGIDDQDEALDQFGNPIDIGKHLVVVGAYASSTSSASLRLNGGKVNVPTAQVTVRNVSTDLASMITTMPVDQEPIGPVNGVIPGVAPINQRIRKSVLNDLALGRVVMLDENGAISTIRTAALPNSDFTRISTIRAANALLSEIRRLALPLLGRNYRNAKDTLNTQILGRMRAFGQAGVIQPGTGVAQIIQSRADEIAGRMRILVSFTPPFALEQITVDLTLTPPA